MKVQLKLSVFLILAFAILAELSLSELPQKTKTSEFFAKRDNKNKNTHTPTTNIVEYIKLFLLLISIFFSYSFILLKCVLLNVDKPYGFNSNSILLFKSSSKASTEIVTSFS